MRIMEFTAFIALSGALHAATLVVAPFPGGGSSGGQGGTADVTLQAATPTLAAMVQDWDRAPEVSDAPALAVPDATTAPVRPAQDMAPAPRPQIPALAALNTARDVPRIDTRLPAPPVPFAAPAPDALPLPKANTTAMPHTPRAESDARPTPPVQPRVTDSAPTMPEVDSTPAAPRIAPLASLRPESRPERRVAAPSAASPAQTAKGNGAKPVTAAAPARAAPVAKGPSAAQLARLEQQWGAQITSALRRAHRPPRGAAGTVKLVIAITPAGHVAGVSLAGSSGNTRLDQAALAAVKRARFPRAPEGLNKSSYRFSQRLTVSR